MASAKLSAREQKVQPDGWKVYRFDEIAENINERVDDPSQAGVERYVGLEHLDPESLHIRRWGVPTDVEATKLRFWPGDIIFGRRRAYQRKLAVPEFEGICSAHAMVLRAREEVVAPEFLPFFLQSDFFFERALAISVGSLSPTINWKALAREEFALPPIGEQRRIAEILWAADAAVGASGAVVANCNALREAILAESFEFAIGKGLVTTVAEVLEVTQYGTSVRSSRSSKSGVPIVGIPSVTAGYLNLNEAGWTELSEADVTKYQLEPADLLVVRTNGNPQYVGRAILVPELQQTILFASYLVRLRTKQTMNPAYLCLFLNSDIARRELRKQIRSSAGNYNLSVPGLRRQVVPLPPLADQGHLVDMVSQLNNTIAQATAHRNGGASALQQLREYLLSMR